MAVLIRVNWRWRSLSGLVGLLLGLLGEGHELTAEYTQRLTNVLF